MGAVILTGGASSRMGRDKASLVIDGVRAVDHLARLAGRCGVLAVLTSGRNDYGYPNALDATPLGGPVGGIVSGVAMLRLSGCESVLVLAVDAPTLLPEDLAPLFGPAEGAAFVGFPLPFVAPIAGLPGETEARWPIGHLLDLWGVARIPVPPTAADRLKGANTPAEFERLVQAVSGSDAVRR